MFQVQSLDLGRSFSKLHLGFSLHYHFQGKSVFWRNDMSYFFSHLLMHWEILLPVGDREVRISSLCRRSQLLWDGLALGALETYSLLSLGRLPTASSPRSLLCLLGFSKHCPRLTLFSNYLPWGHGQFLARPWLVQECMILLVRWFLITYEIGLKPAFKIFDPSF